MIPFFSSSWFRGKRPKIGKETEKKRVVVLWPTECWARTWFWEAESQYTALQSMAKKGAANKKLKLHCFGYFWHQLGSLWIYKHIYIYQVVWICLILTREPLPRPLPISLGCWYQKMLHTPSTFGRCVFRFFDETDPPNIIWKWSYFPKCNATENPQKITIRVELNMYYFFNLW